ncbi:hypothetical protein LINPERHAP1_LOCUS32322 [Linum perenne]
MLFSRSRFIVSFEASHSDILNLFIFFFSCTLGSISVSLPEDELWCNSSSDVSSFSSNEEVLILTLSSHPKQATLSSPPEILTGRLKISDDFLRSS